MSKAGSYLVREIFGPTIQGEGFHAGRACVFLRFGGCNLDCSWCDTDFAPERSARMSADEIASRLIDLDRHGSRLVIVTGGEPALQWNPPLADRLRAAGFTAHMETNGTRALAAPVDWLTVSPKPQFHCGRGAGESLLTQLAASECKLVVDDTVGDEALAACRATYDCEHWFLQPCMDDRYADHLQRTLDLVTRHPTWKLSLQLHKLAGVP